MTASLLGEIAAHYVAAAAVASVPNPQRLGAPKVTSWSGATSVTGALPQTPTAGNLLIASVVAYGFASFTPTCSTPAGWTAGPTRADAAGSTRLGIWLFWKVAVGGDAAPVFNLIANTASNGGVIMQEFVGLDTAAPHLADSAGATVSGTGAKTLTDALTTTTANEWVYSFAGEQSDINSLTNIAWTGPQTSWDHTPGTNQPAGTASTTATWGWGCYASAGAKAPSVSFTASAGAVTSGIVSMSFKVATGSRPGVQESVAFEQTTAGTSWSLTPATTPGPSDILIAAIAHNDTLGTTTISGCGATWTANEVHDGAGNYEMTVWTGINPTGITAVTITSANARTGVLKYLRVAGTGPTIATSYARNASTATSYTGPVASAGPGQVVVALQAASGQSTSDFPVSSASPALSNWSVDALSNAASGSGSMQDAWIAPASPATSCSVTGTSSSARSWPTAMVVCG